MNASTRQIDQLDQRMGHLDERVSELHSSQERVNVQLLSLAQNIQSMPTLEQIQETMEKVVRKSESGTLV